MDRRSAITAGVMLCLWLIAASAASQEARRPPLPLEVTFSAPIEGEADVRLDAIVRIQFSGDVDARSFDKRIRMAYSAEESAERGEAEPPPIAFEITYEKGSRALGIKPARPLERFRPVSVELLDGILGTDGSVLRPWKLRFVTGGS